MIATKPQPVTTFNNTDESSVTKPARDYGEKTNDMAEVEDEHDVELDDAIATSSYESDNIQNEKFMMNTKSDGVGISFIIKASVVAISAACLSLIIFLVAYKQYKKSTNPLNYKERNESASKKVNEEFSEIRYLTSDETLDFNLASPDNIPDL